MYTEIKLKDLEVSEIYNNEHIIIAGAREHNLKDITVKIPRNKMTVITGLSGSGKSSLAFDTLYAEGQRRYVESLSAYARQFLHQMSKPDVDHIEGLSPAISIEQRTAGTNPRSTVGTSTEIHDYLRLLFANIGKAHCPKCKLPVASQSAEQIVEQLLTLPNRTRLTIMAPLVRGRKGQHEEIFSRIRKQGFVRVRVDGTIYDIEDLPELDKNKVHTIEVVIDRLIVTSRIRARLTDSVELALNHGDGIIYVICREEGGEDEEVLFSEKNACVKCGISFEPLQPRSFSFNSPYGACPTCSGLGTQLIMDPDLVVPDKSLSIEDGAIKGWRRGGRRLIIYYKKLLLALAKHYDFDLDVPFEELDDNIKNIILYGSGDEDVDVSYWRGGKVHKYSKPFEGVIPNLMRRYENSESDYIRQQLRKYMGRRLCPDCKGARLRKEVIACTINGKSIVDITSMSLKKALRFFKNIKITEYEREIAGEVLNEICRRINFLVEVGLDYLTLDRESGTLSGGELQRIRLATQIGSGLVGVLYVLDEPTIGLHVRDNKRLIKTLKALRDVGNTVVIVEHDEDMIKEADYVIDLGPGAGHHGGDVIFQGDVKSLLKHETSLTARYMTRKSGRAITRFRYPPTKEKLKIWGAAENNLANIDVEIPLGLFVCVTGVSGSGKSTLVDDILRRAMFRRFYGSSELPGKHNRITGADKLDKVVVIDQTPIGRTPRSNPATYTGVFSIIRKLFSETQSSKIRGYGPGRFSFNVKGGRCETCKGDGILKLEMHFLPDVYVVCEHCRGKRYNRETLEVLYGDKNIAEILEMTINEAVEFFANIPSIARKLNTLVDVGLGYLQLGQAATTLSGGEAQRIKLSSELSKKATGKTLYLLDEPTTGLHFADVDKLLQVLQKLREAGNTIVVIEHNMDVIMASDYIIDMGPEGGDGGGRIVAAGSPEEVAQCAASYTGRHLKKLFKTGRKKK